MDLDQSGKLLATASGDGTVRTWFIKDMDKGKEIKLVKPWIILNVSSLSSLLRTAKGGIAFL